MEGWFISMISNHTCTINKLIKNTVDVSGTHMVHLVKFFLTSGNLELIAALLLFFGIGPISVISSIVNFSSVGVLTFRTWSDLILFNPDSLAAILNFCHSYPAFPFLHFQDSMVAIVKHKSLLIFVSKTRNISKAKILLFLLFL